MDSGNILRSTKDSITQNHFSVLYSKREIWVQTGFMVGAPYHLKNKHIFRKKLT